ncbi:hypothetical protein L0152_23975, partial [bacterium]|nr:hypothetical protein [bacterium]
FSEHSPSANGTTIQKNLANLFMFLCLGGEILFFAVLKIQSLFFPQGFLIVNAFNLIERNSCH